MTDTITDHQIQSYLDSCNRLLSSRMADAENQQILDLAERIHGRNPIGLEIYGNDQDRPCRTVTIRLRNRRFEWYPNSDEKPLSVWKINRARLIAISKKSDSNPQETGHTDWNCLASRLGLGGNATE